MIRRILAVAFTVPLGLGACARTQKARDPSSLAYSPVAAEFRAARPVAVDTDSVTFGPPTCDDEGCPSLGTVVRPLFEATESMSISTLLSRLDERMADLALRTVDHFVPCLEEEGRATVTKLGLKINLSADFNCYVHFPLATETERSAFFEQVLFSRGDSSPASDALRLGNVDDDATTLWVQRNATLRSFDVWRATSRALVNQGRTLLQLRIGPDKNFEASTVALNQFVGDNFFACGAQARGNGELLFVQGRFVPVTDITFTRDSSACEGVKQTTFCVHSEDFVAADTSACADAGLTTFALTALGPQDLETEDWGDSVNIDHSDVVPRFSLDGLDIY